tara:strand:+ start:39 stop:743 length:705 start_codon:yes stop_codon:yes gene_type:complete
MVQKLQYIIYNVFFLITACHSLKGRWFANGKKPAPFSKKYRDANPEASKYGGSDGSSDDEISNTKMLIFFGVCFVGYILWSRKASTGSTTTSASGMRRGGGNTLGAASSTASSSSRSSASTTRNNTATTSSSSSTPTSSRNAATMREARLKALSRLDKNMADAAKNAPKQSSSNPAPVKSKSSVQKRSGGSSNSSSGVHGFSSSNNSSTSNGVGSSDATADDRARLIFPDDKEE